MHFDQVSNRQLDELRCAWIRGECFAGKGCRRKIVEDTRRWEMTTVCEYLDMLSDVGFSVVRTSTLAYVKNSLRKYDNIEGCAIDPEPHGSSLVESCPVCTYFTKIRSFLSSGVSSWLSFASSL